jgi:hypothetical protein
VCSLSLMSQLCETHHIDLVPSYAPYTLGCDILERACPHMLYTDPVPATYGQQSSLTPQQEQCDTCNCLQPSYGIFQKGGPVQQTKTESVLNGLRVLRSKSANLLVRGDWSSSGHQRLDEDQSGTISSEHQITTSIHSQGRDWATVRSGFKCNIIACWEREEPHCRRLSSTSSKHVLCSFTNLTAQNWTEARK